MSNGIMIVKRDGAKENLNIDKIKYNINKNQFKLFILLKIKSLNFLDLKIN